MIALVRVLAPPASGGGTEELRTLPEPPGLRYTAFAAYCENAREVRGTLAWYRMVLESRVEAPLGLIAREPDCVQHLVRLDHSLVFLMNPGLLHEDGLPLSALQMLREAGVEGRILEELVREHGPATLSEQESLRALIARAVAGGTIGRAASDLGVCPDTLARRLKGVGLSPRALRRQVRARGYELRMELGMERRAALAATGWTDHEQRRKAMARLRIASQKRQD